MDEETEALEGRYLGPGQWAGQSDLRARLLLLAWLRNKHYVNVGWSHDNGGQLTTGSLCQGTLFREGHQCSVTEWGPADSPLQASLMCLSLNQCAFRGVGGGDWTTLHYWTTLETEASEV